MTTRFRALWNQHPGPDYVCDPQRFPNQCAMRLGAALERNAINVTERGLRTCRSEFSYEHEPGHVLSAQELANLLWRKPNLLGAGVRKRKFARDSRKVSIRGQDLKHLRGIIFIQNGWGSTDHIDLWDGKNTRVQLRGVEQLAQQDYKRTKCRAIWFWEF